RRLAPAGPTRAARAGRACRTARSGRLAEPVGRPLPACGRRAGRRVRAAARVPAEAERGRQRVGGGQPRTRGFRRPAGRLDEPRDAALRRVPGHGGATPARLTTHAARSPIPARTVGPSGYCRGMDVILVPGFWLDASSWDAVLPALRAAGHRPHPMTLPGLESREADRSGITLRDHVAAVVAEIDTHAQSAPVVVVGHSGGGPIVHGAVDARPDKVARAIYVDAGPLSEGASINP